MSSVIPYRITNSQCDCTKKQGLDLIIESLRGGYAEERELRTMGANKGFQIKLKINFACLNRAPGGMSRTTEEKHLEFVRSSRIT